MSPNPTPKKNDNLKRKSFSPSIVAKSIRRFKNDNDAELIGIVVPFSSLSEDRDGDRFSEDGLKDMVAQINSQKIPCFLNHGWAPGYAYYDVRNIMGFWQGAKIEDGVAEAELVLNGANADAQDIAQMIEAGMPVSFSVGFIPQNMDNDKNGEIFNSSDLLEISAVGIPSNPDAVHSDGMDELVAMVAKKLGDSKIKVPEELHMTPAEKAALEAEKAAKAAAVKKQEGDDEDTGDDDTGDDDTLTADKVREIVAEEMSPVKETLNAILELLKEKKGEDEDEEDKAGGDEDEDEEDKACDDDDKKAAKPKPKALPPKGISVTEKRKKDGEGEEEKSTPAPANEGGLKFTMPTE